METFQYTITDEIGIHARPAGELAKLAKEFQSKITIKTETKQADAERLMAVMDPSRSDGHRGDRRSGRERGGRGGTGLFSGKTVRRIYEYGDHKRKINLK